MRCDALDRVHIGLDYFDASINRIGAYVIGSRATQKGPDAGAAGTLAQLRAYEANGQGFERLALLEESKSLPWNAVWDMFCRRNDVPVGETFIADVQQYERDVTSNADNPMEIFIGLLIIALGSFGQSSSYVPINRVRGMELGELLDGAGHLRVASLPAARGPDRRTRGRFALCPAGPWRRPPGHCLRRAVGASAA